MVLNQIISKRFTNLTISFRFCFSFNLYGISIRISFNLNGQPDTGWFLLRLSVHDPVMPLNAESDVEGGVRKMLADLYEVLSHVKGICLDDLKKTAEEV